jgi:glycosyl transferase family 25
VNPPKADPSDSSAARGTEWPIFVLSLEGDEGRRAPLLNSLAEMGLDAEVLIGVDGRAGLPDWAEAEVDRTVELTWDYRPARYVTDGVLACALSHVCAYRKMINDGLPGAIIFEDDAIVGEPLRRFMAAEGYKTGEMVLLGHEDTWVRRFSATPLCQGVVGHRLVASPVLTHGYSLSRKAASYILARASPVRTRADWPCDISRIESWAADPQIALQPAEQNAKSHLEEDRVALRRKKNRDKRSSRYFSRAYWMRMLRKKINLVTMRKWFCRRIA